MHFIKYFIYLVTTLTCCTTFSSAVSAQTLSNLGLEEHLLELILDDLEQEVDLSEFTERLRYYLAHPIDLNNTDERQLGSLFFLSSLQIANLLSHRKEGGLFQSILELQAIDGFDLQTVEKLVPFVTVSAGSPLKELTINGVATESDQQLMLRYARILERQQGYAIVDTNRSRYLGSADRYMVRYRLHYKDNLRLSINLEKDAGEPFFRERQRVGFDHYGVSLLLRSKSWVKEFVLGDYALQIGQGLVMWNGLSFGKGSMITSSARQGIGLDSYTSMNETGFLRGLSARLVLTNDIEITPFVSWRKLSGSVTETEDNTRISSLSVSGLHRTPNELANKDQIDQYVYGVDLTYQHKRLKIGLVTAYTKYGWPIAPSTELRNLGSFAEQTVLNTGLNYQTTFKNIYFFSETAYQWNGTYATLNGAILSLNPQFSIFANYRNYQRLYYAPFSQALGEGSEVANEKGVYAGLSFRMGRKIEWVSYVDQFRFPWLRFGVDAPSSGVDLFSQFTYMWYKMGQISLRYRYRARQENSDTQSAEYVLADVLRDQLRLDFRYKLTATWEIHTRGEVLFFRKESRNEFGRLIYQDLFWRPQQRSVQLNLRLALFSTDSYDARLYAFENDVLYAYSFPLYNGKGWRSYLNAQYRINRALHCWLRYSVTRYSGQTSVGSGLDESDGPLRSEIKVQLRYQW